MKSSRMLWSAGTAVVALLAVAAGWFLALSPMLDEVATASTQADAVEATNETRRLEVARLAAERENLPALEAELDGLRRQFPTDLELESFVQRLADLSARSGAKVTSVSRSAPSASDAGGTGRSYQVAVNLTVEGTFDQLLQYLADLQAEDDRLFLVTAATNLSRRDTDSMTITGYTFVLVDADRLPSAADDSAEEDSDPEDSA